jgi:uncharacterized protein (DUF362 family)/Pyruvate/2-oxoacid:ferredoxin oxidoreductase delta subunit
LTNRQTVSLVECEDYESDAVRKAVARAFNLIGGVSAVVSPGESVFVKVNAVTASSPDTARVTHPQVARAVVEQLLEVTDGVTIGDSPGGPFNHALLKRVYEKTGIADVARETGARLAMDTGVTEVSFPDGKAIKRVSLCSSIVQADRLVSVSKFKTHRYMNITGPVKNLYGTVPGTMKFVYHSRFEDEREFADLIVDVHLAAKPTFHVVDAIEAIDGDGSRNGDIKKMRAIGASSNAFALESLMMKLVGFDPSESKVLNAAILRGVCPAGTDWFDILGDDPGTFDSADFRLPSASVFSERIPARLTGRLNRLVSVAPRPLAGKCTRCGTCAKVCPREAITIGEAVAEVDLKRCIRCFCCDELCEYDAIGLRKPFLVRVREWSDRHENL